MKIRVVIKRPFGDVELEGDSLDELIEGLQAFPDWLAVIDKLIISPEMPAGTQERLTGLIEFSKDGPLVIVPREKISDKEAIGLLLYAQDPEGLEPKEVGRLLDLSGRPSMGFGSRLSEIRREGLVIKEDNLYRLSAAGRKWTEDLVSRLRGG
ncbi:MAG: hypothetical protein AOA65_0008 [Candidatus Bathyarchaeota archaeon BA1]|nr:MAG: hypothetical protein AOA65_0008 [Candidatus Bathyarchaeota archaeon BA1]